MSQHLPCTRSYPPQKKPIPSTNFFFNNDLLQESQQRNISNELIMSSILQNQAKQLEKKMNHVIVDSRNDLQHFVSADTNGGHSYNVAEQEVIEQATEENMEDSEGSDTEARVRGKALFDCDSQDGADQGSWQQEEFKGESINYTSRDLSPRSTEEAEISERQLNLEMLSTERKKRKTNLTLQKSPKPVNAETRHECREVPIWEQGVQEVEEPVTSRIQKPVQQWEIFDEKPILHPASFIPAAHDHSEVNHQKSRNVKEPLFYQREGDASTTQTSSGGHLHRSKMNSISVLPAQRFENKLVDDKTNEDETGLSLLQQRKRKARHCHRRTQSKTFDPSFVSALLTSSTAYVEKSNNF